MEALPHGSPIGIVLGPGQAEIRLPRSGLGGAGCVLIAFAACWLGFIAALTWAAVRAGGILVVLLIPFWLAGLGFAAIVVWAFFAPTTVVLRAEEMEITKGSPPLQVRRIVRLKDLEEVGGARPAGGGLGPEACILRFGSEEMPLGGGLSPEELRWLAGVLNEYIRAAKGDGAPTSSAGRRSRAG